MILHMGFVRTARPDDAGAIAAIQLAAWRTRYPTWPDEVWADLAGPGTAAAWLRAIELPPTAEHRILVATEDSGEVRGFATLAPDEDPSDGALIEMFEVDPDHRTAGHGSRLISACAAHAPGPDLLIWIDQGSDASRFLVATGWGPRGRRRVLEIAPNTQLAQHQWWTTIENA